LRDALYGAGVAAVEWFDRLAPVPDDEVLLITLRFTTGEGEAYRERTDASIFPGQSCRLREKGPKGG